MKSIYFILYILSIKWSKNDSFILVNICPGQYVRVFVTISKVFPLIFQIGYKYAETVVLIDKDQEQKIFLHIIFALNLVNTGYFFWR